MKPLNEYELLIFDVDGTLVSDYNSDQLLPQAVKFFKSLSSKVGPAIALASNQGGVGLRYWMEEGGFGEPKKYPTKGEASERIYKIARQLENLYRFPIIKISWIYQSRNGNWSPSPPNDTDLGWSQEWRKPSAGMLFDVMLELAVTDTPERVLMIGDGDEDRLAAQAARCDYVHPNDLLGETNG